MIMVIVVVVVVAIVVVVFIIVVVVVVEQYCHNRWLHLLLSVSTRYNHHVILWFGCRGPF